VQLRRYYLARGFSQADGASKMLIKGFVDDQFNILILWRTHSEATIQRGIIHRKFQA
jgi:hypothetical protein